jgi:hypothetical protein
VTWEPWTAGRDDRRGLWSAPVSDEAVAWAVRHRAAIDAEGGEGLFEQGLRWMGSLGELAFDALCRERGWPRHWNRDVIPGDAPDRKQRLRIPDFVVCGSTVAVKTRQVRGDPHPLMEVWLPWQHAEGERATEEEVFFLAYDHGRARIWAVGGCPHWVFMDAARLHREGEPLPSGAPAENAHYRARASGTVAPPEAWFSRLGWQLAMRAGVGMTDGAGVGSGRPDGDEKGADMEYPQNQDVREEEAAANGAPGETAAVPDVAPPPPRPAGPDPEPRPGEQEGGDPAAPPEEDPTAPTDPGEPVADPPLDPDREELPPD